MSAKRIVVIGTLIGIMMVATNVAGAQDTGGRHRIGGQAIRELVRIVAEEIGLEPREVVAQLQEGMTLAEVIEANGGNVEAIVTDAVSAATEQIAAAVTDGFITRERADRLLANLEDTVRRAINGDLFPRRDGLQSGRPLRAAGGRILVQVVADETGLEPATIVQQVRDGATLADIIVANGGSVENVVAAAVAESTEQINAAVENERLTREQADELIAALDSVYTEAVNGELGNLLPPGPGPRVVAATRRGLVRQVAHATGLSVEEVTQHLRQGESLADVLTANGVSVETFINDIIARAEERLDRAVENGHITQERADEMLASLRQRLAEMLNRTFSTESSQT